MEGKLGSIFETPSLPDGAGAAWEYKRIRKRGQNCGFRCLKEYFGKEKPWGLSDGRAPHEISEGQPEKLGDQEAERMFFGGYGSFRQKYELVNQICRRQQPVFILHTAAGSGYLCGIPFLYFALRPIVPFCSNGKHKGWRAGRRNMLMPLIRERCMRLGISLRAGCAASISAEERQQRLPLASWNACWRAVAELAQGEFTVEAGRPDTITPKEAQPDSAGRGQPHQRKTPRPPARLRWTALEEAIAWRNF